MNVRDRHGARRAFGPTVEGFERRLLLTSAGQVVAGAYQPLRLEGFINQNGVLTEYSGTLQLKAGSTKGSLVGVLDDRSIGIVPVSATLSKGHLRLNLPLCDGSTATASGPAVSGLAVGGGLTLESEDVVRNASGAGIGFLGIQGPTLATSLKLPHSAVALIRPGTTISPFTFTLDVTRGADKGTSLSGVLDLGTVHRGGQLSGVLRGTVQGDVPVHGRFVGDAVQLTFGLGHGKSLQGVGPFEQIATGTLLAVGTLTGSGKGDAGYWAGGGAPSFQSISSTTGPTVGGTSITITGTNLGASASVTIGGVNAPVTSDNGTKIVFTTPSGTGVGKAISVTIAGATYADGAFNYNPPMILSISPQSGPTLGGTSTTLTGVNFGTNATVTFSSKNATIISQTDTTLVFTTPVGMGLGNPVQVSVASQISNTLLFNYAPPVITSISPQNTPGSSGSLLAIFGSNFGTAPTVTIGGKIAPIKAAFDSTILVTIPVGMGLNNAVQVSVAGQNSNTGFFSYNTPMIASISPATGPTAGNTSITINGANFGTSAIVTIGGKLAPTVSQTDTTLVVTTPAGMGTNKYVQVTVGGQPSNMLPFNYHAPAIYSFSPNQVPTAGGTLISLIGVNFGTAALVTIGGKTAPLISQTDTTLVVSLPAGTGLNNPVQVTVDGQVSNTISLNYNAPAIASLSASSGPTIGGTSITLIGVNFGTAALVTIGGVAAQVTSQTDSNLVVTTPAGMGVGNLVQVTVAGQISNTLPFNYNGPVIKSINLRHGPTTGGSLLAIYGTNFGTAPTVTIGGNLATVVIQNDTTMIVTTPVGMGLNKDIQVTVVGQVSNALTFSYDAPVITSLSQLSGPAAGNTTLTITGLNFGTSAIVTIGGLVAHPTTSQSDTTLVVTTPAGSGTNNQVVVYVSGQQSNVLYYNYE